jgi:hypothetical protein
VSHKAIKRSDSVAESLSTHQGALICEVPTVEDDSEKRRRESTEWDNDAAKSTELQVLSGGKEQSMREE